MSLIESEAQDATFAGNMEILSHTSSDDREDYVDKEASTTNEADNVNFEKKIVKEIKN